MGSIYTQLGSKHSFLLELNRILTEIGSSQCLIGGDWNQTRDAVLDRTGPIDANNNADRALLENVIKDQGLADHWQLTHPIDKD